MTLSSQYGNWFSFRRGRTGAVEDMGDDDDYENVSPTNEAPPVKPGKRKAQRPGSIAPPRPPRAGRGLAKPTLPDKSPKEDLTLTTVSCPPPRLGLDLNSTAVAMAFEPPQDVPPPARFSQKGKMVVSLCVLVGTALLLGLTGLALTLLKYQETAQELRMLTLQQLEWVMNVSKVTAEAKRDREAIRADARRELANLWAVVPNVSEIRKDIEQIKMDANRAVQELRDMLGCPCNFCPKNWLPFKGKCYYFSTITKTWENAGRFCMENLSHLVTISNTEEQKFLAKVHGSPRIYWLGLSDRHREGQWQWMDGSPVSLSFWQPGEPNNRNGENCGAMSQDGSWNDLDCDQTTYWICEKQCTC
ncbi:C-type lectin domain family 17, member A isoform X1 [Ornithorhynchus anatinus]|uniref:C-type lectin domain containing 17A n=1 Tax=Ornithorhynchus anatinus TaxID=9258 RepID=A0A6I8NAB6_ORNAN|nr:C-type lectin domain family 17, member A isoform X1 [Ornithorhynchus anatinus]